MPGGRPRKKARNVAGLRNQHPRRQSSTSSTDRDPESAAEMITEQSQATTPAASGSESDDLENELESRPQAQAAKSLSDTVTIAFDGLKSDFAQEYLDFCDEDSDIDDFRSQVSMLEELIRSAGHECIFLPKFHCELNPIEMYWGWCKYRYREASKPNFAAAKRVATEILDSCPVDVIRRFINRSHRFRSAYQAGLTGRAAEWAVKKHKQHRAISQRAMMTIEAVLDH